MSKEFKAGKNALTVYLRGEIDQYKANEMKQKIDIEIEQSTKKNLIIDLSEVDLMDSSGIGLIVGRYKLTLSLGGTTVICSAKKNIAKMIELSGIEKVISYYKSADDAERALSLRNWWKE